jgi:diketogulonate reductase-like aldo/keto reductase
MVQAHDNYIKKMQKRTTKLHRLDENIGAASIELTPDDLRDIDTAASKITVQGARYPEKLEKMTRR